MNKSIPLSEWLRLNDSNKYNGDAIEIDVVYSPPPMENLIVIPDRRVEQKKLQRKYHWERLNAERRIAPYKYKGD